MSANIITHRPTHGEIQEYNPPGKKKIIWTYLEEKWIVLKMPFGFIPDNLKEIVEKILAEELDS